MRHAEPSSCDGDRIDVVAGQRDREDVVRMAALDGGGEEARSEYA